MIYILTEQAFNGTVTMGVTTTGVEADSFREAVDKVKETIKDCHHSVSEDTEERFSFYLTQEKNEDGFYFGHGANINSKPLKML